VVDSVWGGVFNDWYGRTFVVFEVVKCCVGRCLTVLGGFNERGFKVHNLAFWNSCVKYWLLDRKPSNVYRSISVHSGLPIFSFNHAVRGVTRKKFFEEDYLDSVVSFRRVLDFDNPGKKGGDLVVGLELVKAEVLRVVKFLVGEGFSVKIIHSGSGFNVELLGDGFSVEELKLFGDFVVGMIGLLGLKFVDKNVFDPIRVFKVPYSLDCKNGHVVLPVSLFDFERFKYDDYHYKVVLNNFMIKGRGENNFWISKENLGGVF